MPGSIEALTVLLVLLPGFVCAKIVQGLFVRPQQTELERLIEALVFSFMIYLGFTLTFPTAKLNALSSKHLVFLATYSVGLGLITAAALTNDWFGRIFRKLKVTQRTSNVSVWNDTFKNFGGYIFAELADGRMLVGWVRYFSDREEQTSLFLEDAAWVDTTNGQQIQIPIDGAGILLTKDSGVRNIMFLHEEERRSKKLAHSARA